MKCHTTVKCPHYNGDGYGYQFDAIEFLFCSVCHDKLFKKMIEQKTLEKKLKEMI